MANDSLFSKKVRCVIFAEPLEYMRIMAQSVLMIAKNFGADIVVVYCRNERQLNKAQEALDIVEIQYSKQYFKSIFELDMGFQGEITYITSPTVMDALNLLSIDDFYYVIISGLHGASHKRQTVLGGITQRLLDECPFMHLILPLEVAIDIPKSMVLAVSSKFPLNERFFKFALNRFLKMEDKLVISSLVLENDDVLKTHAYLKKLSNEFGLPNSRVELFDGFDALEEFKSFLFSLEDAILVVQQGSRKLTDKNLKRFIFNDIVLSGNIPILIVPHHSTSHLP